jgi:alpha-ketoglutarate-dependent taurine dioxygenase
MYMAYDILPENLRRRVEGRVCRHDSSRNSAGELAPRLYRRDRSTRSAGRRPSDHSHPSADPAEGVVSRPPAQHVYQGLELDDSERLLDALWEHATGAQLTWYQQWRVGDFVLWDNRCVMHRRDEFDSASRRLMHRSQIKGDRPF